MPRRYSSRKIIQILEENGFQLISQKGSHIKLSNTNTQATVIVPANRKEIPAGTFNSIVRQARLEKEVFER